jgi:phenylacetate-CoA ligase
MPIIDEICGRLEDTVVGPDGREMVRFHSVFVDIPFLVSAQVVQEELDDIRINAVTEDKFGASEEEVIVRRVRSQLGDVRVTVDRVQELVRNSAGKVPAVISKVGKS